MPRLTGARNTGLLAAALLAACSGDPGTGPIEVKWDRDVCQRCNMVLSDRQHAAQVRHSPTDGTRGRVYTFDDVGCAVLWLDKQPWREGPGVEFWVTDHATGAWIDARSAYYVRGRITPMQYGLGAQREMIAGALDYAQAVDHIYTIERRFNVHGGNLDHPPSPAPSTAPLPPIGQAATTSPAGEATQ